MTMEADIFCRSGAISGRTLTWAGEMLVIERLRQIRDASPATAASGSIAPVEQGS